MEKDILDIFIRAALSLDKLNRQIHGLLVAGRYSLADERIAKALDRREPLEEFCMAYYNAAEKDLGLLMALEDLVAGQLTIEEELDDEDFAP
jgi:hypothetical protein